MSKTRGYIAGIDDQGVTHEIVHAFEVNDGVRSREFWVLAVAPATMASASPTAFVPCSSGAAVISRRRQCGQRQRGQDGPPHPGMYIRSPPTRSAARTACRLSSVRIAVFGNGATITGSGAVRIFEVDGQERESVTSERDPHGRIRSPTSVGRS